MNLPGDMDFGDVMKRAQEMQEELQRDLAQVRVEASAGGGIVTAVMNGSKELLDLKLESDVVKNGDVEMLQDLIIAAVNEASRKVDEAIKAKLGSKLGGLGLPGGLF